MERGEVVLARRRLGFGADGASERFVVVSTRDINQVLPLWIVAPIAEVSDTYARLHLAVPVTKDELGGDRDAVIVTWALSATAPERFDPAPCGCLRDSTLAQVDDAIRVVLGLD